MKKYFPMPYISPDNGEKVEAGQGEESSPGSTIPISTGKTGAQGHQENRDLKDSPGSDWAGGIRDIDPGVTGVKTGKDASGREKVFVELKSGATMRFQWQFKNAAGEWEDIFGANASHYTLGRQFALKQTYQLRCKITNQAGKITYTDVIEAMRTVDGAEGLQAKEEGPAIEGENLMDAGEEVDVANTATNGQILALIAGTALLACLTAAAIAISRRREK